MIERTLSHLLKISRRVAIFVAPGLNCSLKLSNSVPNYTINVLFFKLTKSGKNEFCVFFGKERLEIIIGNKVSGPPYFSQFLSRNPRIGGSQIYP